jgi:hypothetical protein
VFNPSEANWIVYDFWGDDIAAAETREDAMDIADSILDSYTRDKDGIPKQIIEGSIVVAKVTDRSAFKITDLKSDYDNAEDWPYDQGIDMVGDLCMQEEEEE